VPRDLLQKARAHDKQKNAGLVIELRSHLPIDQQVRAIGATWLDKRLVGDGSVLAGQGFGAQVRDAMRERVGFLATQGLAKWRDQRAVLVNDLLATLREQDLAAAGRALEGETGHNYRPVQANSRVDGLYRQSIQLASGRFAVLDDGVGFSLVPWRPVIEQRLGQHLSVVMTGGSSTWLLGRQRDPGI